MKASSTLENREAQTFGYQRYQQMCVQRWNVGPLELPNHLESKHITSARPGVGGSALLEILEGPYLVQPSDLAFDNGERPLNLAGPNMVWMSADELNWIQPKVAAEDGPMVALLWGDLQTGKLSGSISKLPVGYQGDLLTFDGDLKAVVIQGELTHAVSSVFESTILGPGGYFSSERGVRHSLSCKGDSDCLIYVRTDGWFRLE